MQSPLRRAGLLLLIAFAASLVCASQAQAVLFTVNSTAADADPLINGDCDTDPTADDDCTLVAAIEEANATPAADSILLSKVNNGSDPDDVAFIAGQAPSVVSIAGNFPTITAGLSISGGNCSSDPSDLSTPCANVGTDWEVDSEGEVSIEGLAFIGTPTAIDVTEVNGSSPSVPDFRLSNSWFGADTAGDAATPPATSVLLEDVDGARIGDPSGGRNVFARHGTGVDILGADNTLIQNNTFGVLPDGSFARAGQGSNFNGDSIEVTGDATPSPNPATGTLIGGTSVLAGDPVCVGPCNVINSAGQSESNPPNSQSAGIELTGEAGQDEIPADGVQIVGNQIGVDDGIADKPANTVGISIGTAADVEVGGPTAGEQDRNLISGNAIRSAAGASGLLIQDNVILPDLNEASLNLQGSGEVLDNEMISGATHAAIQLANTSPPNFVVQGNEVQGGIGMVILASASGNAIGGAGAGEGNLLFGGTNLLVNPTAIGVRIAGDGNDVLGNTIGVGPDGSVRSALAGIQLVTDADNNVIGDTTAAGENVISNSTGSGGNAGDAISVTGATSDGNEILRNRGSGNSGLFIDLGDDGIGNLAEPNGPNTGAQAPSISTVTHTTATGTAAPGALVRLFTKADASAGELEGFLTEATADASGVWQAAFASQPSGRLLAATATIASNTSELSNPVAVPADPAPPADPGPPDTDAPETTIDKAPKDKLKAKKTAKATYTFSSDEAGSTFLCTLDKKPQAPCSSPLKLKKLRKGKHTFSVVAVDAAGNTDSSPATDTFKVKKKRR